VVLAKVSRDARAVLLAIQSLSGREASIEDVFSAEELVYSFYGKTIVGHIKRMYNPNSKSNPNTVSFYDKPTRSLNKGRRNKEDWRMTDEERRVYWLVCNSYLIEDFNHDALQQLRMVCRQKYEDVNEAISISNGEDVRSIPYLWRVVEGLRVRREHKRRQIEDRRRLFMGSTEDEVNVRGKAEIASLMYDWQETIQNVELQRRVEALHEED
jgi:hypothetical protein